MALRKRRQVSTRTGILTIGPGGPRLDGKILLARWSGPHSVAAAARYLKQLGFKDGDRIRVTGTYCTLAGKNVFSITAVEKIKASSSQRAGTALTEGQGKRAAESFVKWYREGANKASKKSAKKKLDKGGAAHKPFFKRGEIGAGGPQSPRKKATRKKSSGKYFRSTIGHEDHSYDFGAPMPPPPPYYLPGKGGYGGGRGFYRPSREPQKAKPISSGKTRGGPPKSKKPPKANGNASPPRPELRAIEATPQLDIVKTLTPGASYRMAVFVDQGAAAAGSEVERVKLKIPWRLRKVAVDVWFDCSSHFSIQDIANPSRVTIQVSTGVSEKLEFTLNIAKGGNNNSRPRYVSAFFRYQDRPCGKIKRYLDVKDGELAWKKPDPPPPLDG
ncbi:MAG TPA: hypothetical protein VI685_03910, partial [Candidatus Angelobacter sp.]